MQEKKDKELMMWRSVGLFKENIVPSPQKYYEFLIDEQVF